jgi:aryl-alcohol dehydrogenase-like predicted oxidoreductase
VAGAKLRQAAKMPKLRRQDWVLDEQDSMKVLQAVWDAGISTIDTANIYSAGESERLIGKFLKEQKIPREQVGPIIRAGTAHLRDRS